jgi:hypothetical protein
VLIVPLTQQPAGAQDAAGWKRRLLSEAPQAWEAYWSFAGRLQGTRQVAYQKIEDNKRLPTGMLRIEYKQRDLWTLLVFHNEQNGRHSHTAKVTNSKYSFELAKSDRDWTITDLRAPIAPTDKQVKERKQYVVRDLCTLLFIHGTLISKLLPEPTFVVKEVIARQTEGRDLVRVRFADRPNPPTSERPAIEGWVELDPEQSWVIREGEYEGTFGGFKGKIKFENTFKPSRFADPGQAFRMGQVRKSV